MATTTAIISQSFAMRNLSGAILKLSCRSSGKGFRPNINRNKILKSKNVTKLIPVKKLLEKP